MKKTLALCSIFLLLVVLGFSQTSKLTGAIGPYSIEMSLTKGTDVNTISGKYNYQGKTAFLDIKGQLFDDVMLLEESYKGKETGSFYLQIEGDSLTGKWVHETRSYDVRLKVVNNTYDCFDYFSASDKSEDITSDINGTYEVEYYFLNDMWFEEGKPDIEIGYNGATAVLEKINEDSLRFFVEAICGPTYHFAIADGVAVKHPEENQTYVYTNEDGCEIIIKLDVKEVSMSANAQMECGFGARAYLYHSMVKTSEKVEFDRGY